MISPAPMTPTFPSCAESRQQSTSRTREGTYSITENMQKDTSHIHRALVRVTTVSSALLLVIVIPVVMSLLPVIMSSMRMSQIDTLLRRGAHRAFVRNRRRSSVSRIMRSLDDVRSEFSRMHKELVFRSFSFGRRVGVGSGSDDGGIGGRSG